MKRLPMTDRYVSCAEVAIALGVTKSTVRRWCEKGLVQCDTTPGGEWRILVNKNNWPVK